MFVNQSNDLGASLGTPPPTAKPSKGSKKRDTPKKTEANDTNWRFVHDLGMSPSQDGDEDEEARKMRMRIERFGGARKDHPGYRVPCGTTVYRLAASNQKPIAAAATPTPRLGAVPRSRSRELGRRARQVPAACIWRR
jgi:hypothetical protein